MRKIILFTTAIIFASFLHAQENDRFQFNFNHLAISVKDVNTSLAFYKNVLGLKEITNRSELEGIRWLSLGEGKELHLISILKEDVKLNKAVHIALSTPGFDRFLKKLDDLKIVYSDWPGKENTVNKRADGIKQIYFQDPDGYWIEINSVGEQ